MVHFVIGPAKQKNSISETTGKVAGAIGNNGKAAFLEIDLSR